MSASLTRSLEKKRYAAGISPVLAHQRDALAHGAAAAASAQQSHLDMRRQIEQLAATFSEGTTSKMLVLSPTCSLKMPCESHQATAPPALARKRSRRSSKHSSRAAFVILSW